MKKLILPIIAFLLCLCASATSPFIKSKTYTEFNDIKQDSWYYQSIKDVCELGLMDGISDENFAPDENLTITQCVVLASRLHSIYTSTPIKDSADSMYWADKYINYAYDNAIIQKGQFANLQRPAQAYEAITIFASALPDDLFTKINDIQSIPDVTASFDYFVNVMKFYNAGILCGNDEYGFFLPCSYITRARASAIISRIALPDTRLTYTLVPLKDEYTFREVIDIVNAVSINNPLDDIEILKVGNHAFSLADYRTCYASFKNNYGSENTTALGSKLDVTEYLKSFAGIKMVAEKFNLTISSAQLKDLLEKYYYTRIFYGDNYENILEATFTTDKTNFSNSVLSLFYTQAFIDVFGKNCENGFTNQDVINVAKSQDYICAKHILISKQTEEAYKIAQDVLKLAKSGEDFDALITQYGEDPGMASNPDGYFFTKGKMVLPFEEAAYALSEGQISDIVETDLGYHIIKRLKFDNQKFLKSDDGIQIAYNINIQTGLSYFESLTFGISVTYAPTFDELCAFID